jgi:nitrite reductase/ring-hydroxylating ferredoxin subunit
LPIPFGWFGLVWGDELGRGDVRALYAFDRHLVVWRDDDGTAHVQDPFCPHLGAHLGHGGTVVGAEIQCPFHGWRFDAEGRNTDIPYSARCNGKARLRTFTTVERNGMVMAWWHPDAAVEPQWEVPVVHDIEGAEWASELRAEHTFDAHLQDLAENQVDSVHFRFVHRNPQVPRIDSYETGFPLAVMHATQVVDTPMGPVNATLEVTSVGPGMSIVKFFGVVDTIDLAFTVPITAERTTVRSLYRFRSMGDPELTDFVGQAFVEEIQRQMVREDGPVWEHKAYLRRPALARGDGPFGQFRTWAAQFHPPAPDGVIGEAPEQPVDVWAPPYRPGRLHEKPEGISSADQIADALIARASFDDPPRLDDPDLGDDPAAEAATAAG